MGRTLARAPSPPQPHPQSTDPAGRWSPPDRSATVGPVSITNDLGVHRERIAAAYLTDAGVRVLDRNWRCREGELDIVAREGDALVFCEVKTRRGIGYGHPVEAVTPAKQRRLRLLAQRWLAAHDEHAPDLRFDVVGVLVRPHRPALVTHLRAAFS